MSAYVSKGIVVTFSTLSAELLDINHGGDSADQVETTHQLSTDAWKTFMSGLLDGGEVTLTLHHGGTVPEVGTSGTLAITWPSGAGGFSAEANLSAGGGVGAALGDKMTSDVTFKITGKPTRT